MPAERRLPIGAELQPQGGVHFRVWAPRRKQVAVVLEVRPPASGAPQSAAFDLKAEADGYFAGYVEQASAGTLYHFRLDDEPMLYPDPASRFQPDGVHGPSQVVDPAGYR